MSNIDNIIQKYKNKIFDNQIFFAPDIPPKKLKNAIQKYAFIKKDETPLLLIDDTVFGSAKIGLVLTDKTVYLHEDNTRPFSCSLDSIESVSFKNYVIMKSLVINETLKIHFTQQSAKSLSLVAEMLQEIGGLELKNDTSWSNIGIGVGLGALFGGPIGAAIGAAIGASLENKNATKIDFIEKSPKIIFIVTLASIMAKMAKADGVITQDEADTISELFDELEFDNEERELAKNAFKNAKNDEFSIYDYASQYKEVSDNDLREFLYSTLWLIALSDDYMHNKEEEILKKIPIHLGLNGNKYNEYLNKFQKDNNSSSEEKNFSLKECYMILNCQPSDSMKIIKKNYLKLVSEYHPDTIQSKGLPNSFIEFATEQMQKINYAYDVIKKNRET